jgi:hypothetical protein
LTQFGVGGMFIRWPVYALAAGGVAALFLEQAALHVGPLRASQPFLVIIDPIVSIALSVWLFGERFTADAAVLAAAPATMKADTGTDKEGGGQHGAAGSSGQRAWR